MSEPVLVVKNNLLSPYLNGNGNGLITDNTGKIIDVIVSGQEFVLRDDAEYDFSRKQIIPYVVTRYRNKYLLLQRTTKQAEKRLHNKYSLGIGGHINPEKNMSGRELIMHSLYRELNEEVAVGDIEKMYFVGVINDESNSVSRVHLGLLYVIDLKSDTFEVLESDKMTAQWVPQGSVGDYYSGFETWSQIVYDWYLSDETETG